MDPAQPVRLPRRLHDPTPRPQHRRAGPGRRRSASPPRDPARESPGCPARSSTTSTTRKTPSSRASPMPDEPGAADPAQPEGDETPVEDADFTLNAWRGGKAPVAGRFASLLHDYLERPMVRAPVARDVGDGAGPLAMGRRARSGVDPGAPPRPIADERGAGHPRRRAAVDPGPVAAPSPMPAHPPVHRLRQRPRASSYLRRYRRDGDKVTCNDYSLAAGDLARALARACRSICCSSGSPKDLPWSLQYTLNGTRAVGRARPGRGGGAQEFKVDRLIHGWESDGRQGVLGGCSGRWTTRGSAKDITEIMRTFIGDRLDSPSFAGGTGGRAPSIPERQGRDDREPLRGLERDEPWADRHDQPRRDLGSADKESRVGRPWGSPWTSRWTMLDPGTDLEGLAAVVAPVWYAHRLLLGGQRRRLALTTGWSPPRERRGRGPEGSRRGRG